jgi:hypothetical protein
MFVVSNLKFVSDSHVSHHQTISFIDTSKTVCRRAMAVAIVVSIYASRITQANHWCFGWRVDILAGDGNSVTDRHHDEGGVTVLIHCRTPSPSWYHLKRKVPTEPDDGESIVRARSRYNAVLFHALVACPNRKPMICIPSTRYEGDRPC